MAVLACSGEPEITTELPPGAPRDLLERTGDSVFPDSAAVPQEEGARDSGETGSPAGQDETAPLSEPGAAGHAELPLQNTGVPNGDYCSAVADWQPEWVQFEEEVLLLVNDARSRPADCGSEGQFAAAAPVVMEPALRCSARLHSLDMFERDFFDHTNPDGVDPFERMASAGFHGGGAGENIAVGQASPEQVMRSWMASDGHCANVMRPRFALLGVGYHPGAGGRGLGSNYWTQNFGAPPAPRHCSGNCR